MSRLFASSLVVVSLGLFTISGCGEKFVPPPAGYTDPSDVQNLIKKLDDKDVRERVMAMAMLGMQGAKAQEAIPKLKQIAEKDKNKDLRKHAKKALDKIQGTGS